MMLSDDARRLWDAASRLNRLAVARAGSAVSGATRPLPPLLVLTDPARMSRPWDIAAQLPPGAGLIYRHFGDPDAEAVALRLRAATAERGVALLIGLDADLADRVGADGVHLPERALAAAYALSGRRPDWLLTGAVHSAAAAAVTADLSAVLLSPVFPAGGASEARAALGVAAVIEAVRAGTCPVYALGGIAASNIVDLAESGACGVAGIGAFQQAFAGTAGVRT